MRNSKWTANVISHDTGTESDISEDWESDPVLPMEEHLKKN